MDTYINKPIPVRKRIVLIAHDHRKKDLIEWVRKHTDILALHILCGTGTTAAVIQAETGLTIQGFQSGPLGGDQQIGAKIVDGEIDMMIFFWDPLSMQPHDPDVKALLRIAVLYDIPVANNQATADYIIRSYYMDQLYPRTMIDYANRIQLQVEEYHVARKSIPFKEDKNELRNSRK